MKIPTRIGITYNVKKPLAPSLVEKLVEYLQRNNIEASVCETQNAEVKSQCLDNVDLVVTLGGDGTFLDAVSVVYMRDTPIIGVNLGKLGFLAELTIKDLFPAMEKIIKGKYKIAQRSMINATVFRNGDAKLVEYNALNDVVVSRATSYSHSITIESYIDGSFLGTYRADGLIMSTPTGSTAYSLATNGPIINPSLNVLIACPICPHTLAVRPLVISEKETYSASFFADNVGVSLTYDGIDGIMLNGGDKVQFKVSPYKVKMINVNDTIFYELLRKKLGWV
jgi:NAD+ kinase